MAAIPVSSDESATNVPQPVITDQIKATAKRLTVLERSQDLVALESRIAAIELFLFGP